MASLSYMIYQTRVREQQQQQQQQRDDEGKEKQRRQHHEVVLEGEAEEAEETKEEHQPQHESPPSPPLPLPSTSAATATSTSTSPKPDIIIQKEQQQQQQQAPPQQTTTNIRRPSSFVSEGGSSISVGSKAAGGASVSAVSSTSSEPLYGIDYLISGGSDSPSTTTTTTRTHTEIQFVPLPDPTTTTSVNASVSANTPLTATPKTPRKKSAVDSTSEGGNGGEDNISPIDNDEQEEESKVESSLSSPPPLGGSSSFQSGKNAHKLFSSFRQKSIIRTSSVISTPIPENDNEDDTTSSSYHNHNPLLPKRDKWVSDGKSPPPNIPPRLGLVRPNSIVVTVQEQQQQQGGENRDHHHHHHDDGGVVVDDPYRLYPKREKWTSYGTEPPEEPQLRDIIHSSGLLQKLSSIWVDDYNDVEPEQQDDDIHQEDGYQQKDDDDVDAKSYENEPPLSKEELEEQAVCREILARPCKENSIDYALKEALEDVLTMDAQQPIPCTCGQQNMPPCLYHSNPAGLSSMVGSGSVGTTSMVSMASDVFSIPNQSLLLRNNQHHSRQSTTSTMNGSFVMCDEPPMIRSDTGMMTLDTDIRSIENDDLLHSSEDELDLNDSYNVPFNDDDMLEEKQYHQQQQQRQKFNDSLGSLEYSKHPTTGSNKFNDSVGSFDISKLSNSFNTGGGTGGSGGGPSLQSSVPSFHGSADSLNYSRSNHITQLNLQQNSPGDTADSLNYSRSNHTSTMHHNNFKSPLKHSTHHTSSSDSKSPLSKLSSSHSISPRWDLTSSTHHTYMTSSSHPNVERHLSLIQSELGDSFSNAKHDEDPTDPDMEYEIEYEDLDLGKDERILYASTFAEDEPQEEDDDDDYGDVEEEGHYDDDAEKEHKLYDKAYVDNEQVEYVVGEEEEEEEEDYDDAYDGEGEDEEEYKDVLDKKADQGEQEHEANDDNEQEEYILERYDSQQSSTLSSFDEIPVRCVPQFEPQFLTPKPAAGGGREIVVDVAAGDKSKEKIDGGNREPPPPHPIDFQKYSPPSMDTSLPSRSRFLKRPTRTSEHSGASTASSGIESEAAMGSEVCFPAEGPPSMETSVPSRSQIMKRPTRTSEYSGASTEDSSGVENEAGMGSEVDFAAEGLPSMENSLPSRPRIMKHPTQASEYSGASTEDSSGVENEAVIGTTAEGADALTPPDVDTSLPSRSLIMKHPTLRSENSGASTEDSSGVEREVAIGTEGRGRLPPRPRPPRPPPGHPTAAEEAEDIMYSSHIPSAIKRLDSVQSYQSMVSEITFLSKMESEMESLFSLKIDPRAPQYKMAMEQLQQQQEMLLQQNGQQQDIDMDSLYKCAIEHVQKQKQKQKQQQNQNQEDTRFNAEVGSTERAAMSPPVRQTTPPRHFVHDTQRNAAATGTMMAPPARVKTPHSQGVVAGVTPPIRCPTPTPTKSADVRPNQPTRTMTPNSLQEQEEHDVIYEGLEYTPGYGKGNGPILDSAGHFVPPPPAGSPKIVADSPTPPARKKTPPREPKKSVDLQGFSNTYEATKQHPIPPPQIAPPGRKKTPPDHPEDTTDTAGDTQEIYIDTSAELPPATSTPTPPVRKETPRGGPESRQSPISSDEKAFDVNEDHRDIPLPQSIQMKGTVNAPSDQTMSGSSPMLPTRKETPSELSFGDEDDIDFGDIPLSESFGRKGSVGAAAVGPQPPDRRETSPMHPLPKATTKCRGVPPPMRKETPPTSICSGNQSQRTRSTVEREIELDFGHIPLSPGVGRKGSVGVRAFEPPPVMFGGGSNNMPAVPERKETPPDPPMKDGGNTPTAPIRKQTPPSPPMKVNGGSTPTAPVRKETPRRKDSSPDSSLLRKVTPPPAAPPATASSALNKHKSEDITFGGIGDQEDSRNIPLSQSFGRKGTIGGGSIEQPQKQSSSMIQERFINSPSLKNRPSLKIPHTPRKDSNPLMFPYTLDDSERSELTDGFEDDDKIGEKRYQVDVAAADQSDANESSRDDDEDNDDGSDTHESILGPFASPTVVPRRFTLQQESPRQDSNPLLYPMGLKFFPPSPKSLPPPPIRAQSPADAVKQSAVHNYNRRSVPSMLLPLDSSSSSEDEKYLEKKPIAKKKKKKKMQAATTTERATATAAVITTISAATGEAATETTTLTSSPYPNSADYEKMKEEALGLAGPAPTLTPVPPHTAARRREHACTLASVPTSASGHQGTTPSSALKPPPAGSAGEAPGPQPSHNLKTARPSSNNGIDYIPPPGLKPEPSQGDVQGLKPPLHSSSKNLKPPSPSSSSASSPPPIGIRPKPSPGDVRARSEERKANTKKSPPATVPPNDSYQLKTAPKSVPAPPSQVNAATGPQDDAKNRKKPPPPRQQQYEKEEVDPYYDSKQQQQQQEPSSIVRKLSSLMSVSIAAIRVKLCPMEICYVIDGQQYYHSGYYSGPLNADGLMDGNGCFWFTTGDLYLGQFRRGEIHGAGAMSISDDETGRQHLFKGRFRHNEFLGAM